MEQVLPIDWVGSALVLLALVFFVVDLHVTNHGLPTIGGAAVLTLAILVLSSETPFYLWAFLIVVVVAAVILGVLFLGTSRETLVARGRPETSEVEGMIGEIGTAREPLGVDSPGWVFVHGELWQAVLAVAPENIDDKERQHMVKSGQIVQIVDVRAGKAVVLPVRPGASGYLFEN